MSSRMKENLLADPFAHRAEIDSALAEAVFSALLDHKKAGNPVATWQDGKVVWVAPEDIVLPPEYEIKPAKEQLTSASATAAPTSTERGKRRGADPTV